ncbi:PhzF family phenazine biosynthesis protein [Chitinivorax tropicus]|uniref:PhzF family phenazine biosynthesis protein n=1 Tax=Chitinivorax tropicus TaxID=714531 RepID=A0A840MCX0_9PROT|nr:PhzF family phenazine biosynthesis protein [Chitinivorax tropicus]MBB5017154.1 PhzF family phenazine biosynthesis protein [Chitinivorax tropicus]
MLTYRYHIVNVFAEAPLTGNALAVFEYAYEMSDELMLALAQQMNLSETTFIQHSDKAHAKVRIFTPGGEMPFAGHPVLGSAEVISRLKGGQDLMTLETKAAIVPLWFRDSRWTLQVRAATLRRPAASNSQLASMLSLPVADLKANSFFVDSGNEQLLIRVGSRESVTRCQPRPEEMLQHAANRFGLAKVYVWHRDREQITARYFAIVNGMLIEDPGTGSAAANLGGWLYAHKQVPTRTVIAQGDQIGRPCRIYLEVDENGRVFVGGRVMPQGMGEIRI